MKLIRYFITIFIIGFTTTIAFSENVVINNLGNDTIVTIGEISLEGNKVTKDKIILRELEVQTGLELNIDILDSLLIRSRQNLLNRSLFNFVTITKQVDNDIVEINVDVVERWYIWPIPIIQFADRNINAWLDKWDFGRVNYGIDLRVDNFRGSMESLNIVMQFGYDVVLAAKWSIPYLTKNQIFGMSLNGGVRLNHTATYQTIDNEEQFYTSHSGFAQQNVYGKIGLTFRPKYNYIHGIEFGFDQYVFQDTILKLNPDFGSENTDYNFFSVNYSFKMDFRDFKQYPLDGYYFDASISKDGFGIFNNDVNRISLGANFDQYLHLYRRWYFAYNLGGKVSNDNQKLPYFIKSGLGYFPNNIRGYELYVVDGQQVGKIKSNLKFEVLPQTKFNINWIKSTKFSEAFIAIYANLFFDMAYVVDNYTNEFNPLANQLLWGTGVGIDMITYYDLVLRVEYSVNKQGDSGFFVSFVAPI